MFGWLTSKLKPRTSEQQAKLIAKAVPDIMARYGKLMEEYPLAVLDTSKLPLPKPEMKTLLKVAWRMAADDYMRDAVEAAYVHLSQFQDGVGDRPIEHKLPDEFDPKKVMAALDPWLAWSDKTMDELKQLAAEFIEFKRQSGASDRPEQ